MVLNRLHLNVIKLLTSNLKKADLADLNKELKNLVDLSFYGRFEPIILSFLEANQLTNYISESSFNNLVSHSKGRNLKSALSFAAGLKIEKALKKEKIRFCKLKGFYLNSCRYNDLAKRPIRDIDILVHPDHIKKTITILNKLNFYSKTTNNQQVLLKKKYFIPQLTNHDNVGIDLHYRVTDPNDYNECPLTSELLDEKYKKYHIENHILHIIYHSCIKEKYTNGPIVFSDLHIIFSNCEINSSYLIKKSQSLGVFKQLQMYLSILENEFGPYDGIGLIFKDIDKNEVENFLALNVYNKSNKAISEIFIDGPIKTFNRILSSDYVKHDYGETAEEKNLLFFKLKRFFRLFVKFIPIFLSLFSWQTFSDQIKILNATRKYKNDNSK